MAITIEPYAGADALGPADLTRVVDIFNATWDELLPGEPPVSVEAYRDERRFTHAPHVVESRLARDDSGGLVGFGHVEWRAGEPGAAVLRTFVSPEHRRTGVARSLGSALADVARAAGRTGLTIEVAEGSIGGRICEAAGARPDMVVEQNRALVADPADELLEGWVAQGEAADGYSLVTYDDTCPDDLAQAFIDARHIMNDAPRWEGEGEWTYTVEELRAAEAACAAANQRWWSVGVRHDASGEIVGLSELYLPESRRWIAFQGDTGVAPAHRGHGLGAWMKAVNHLRLRRERPETTTVQTWNAAANEPMLRINRALGFRPVQRYQGWFLPLA
jgi:mycothiol synthase